ncbi:MAG: hypothetical protein ACRD22_20490 [Terriglobia bacterium]
MGLYGNWDYTNPHYQPAGNDVAAWQGTVGHAIMAAAGNQNVNTIMGMRRLVAAFQASQGRIQQATHEEKRGTD